MNKNKKVFMWYKVKELSGKGLNKSQISQELELDRGTVRRYLLMDEQQFQEWITTPRHLPKKLNQYYSFVKELLSNASYLSAAQVEDRLKETFKDLPNVSSKTVYNFVQSIRKQHSLPKHKERQPRQYEKMLETNYGEESQVDFGSYRMLTQGSGRIKVYFFAMVLSRSRHKFVYFQRMPFTTQTANYAHELAFKFFEGIPQRILYDQDRVFVTDENLGDILLTDEFMQFTNVHPFEAVFCRKADPETKGKVENVVKYVKYNFLRGRVFYDIDSLQTDAIAWLERTGNAKQHETTKRIPKAEWIIEKEHLQTYSGEPEKPFQQLPVYPVRKDNTILYRSNFYSVPLGTYSGAGTYICLEEKEGELYLYTRDNQVLTKHTLSLDIGKVIRNNDHAREKSKTLQKSYELALHGLGNSSEAELYLKAIEKDKPRYFHDNLRAILKNIEKQPEEIITQTLMFCFENKILNGNQFAEVLVHYKTQQESENIKLNIDIEPSGNINTSIQSLEPQKSSIKEYESIM